MDHTPYWIHIGSMLSYCIWAPLFNFDPSWFHIGSKMGPNWIQPISGPCWASILGTTSDHQGITSGSLRITSHQGTPRASSTQQHPGAPRSTQEHPGVPRSTQVHPGAPRRTQAHPEAPRSTQKHPEAPRSTQEHPGAPGSTWSTQGRPQAPQERQQQHQQ